MDTNSELNNLGIEKGIPIPLHSSMSGVPFSEIAKRMIYGDSIGNLTPYQVTKLRQSLSSRSKRSLSRKDKNGLMRVWCLGDIVK